MNKYSKWNVNTFNVYTELWFGHMLTFPRLSTTLDLVALMIPLWFPTGFGLYPFNHFCRACMINGDMSGSRTITLDKPSYHSWPALIPKPNQWLRNCVEPPPSNVLIISENLLDGLDISFWTFRSLRVWFSSEVPHQFACAFFQKPSRRHCLPVFVSTNCRTRHTHPGCGYWFASHGQGWVFLEFYWQ